jgi:hypothetical protein
MRLEIRGNSGMNKGYNGNTDDRCRQLPFALLGAGGYPLGSEFDNSGSLIWQINQFLDLSNFLTPG